MQKKVEKKKLQIQIQIRNKKKIIINIINTYIYNQIPDTKKNNIWKKKKKKKITNQSFLIEKRLLFLFAFKKRKQ